MNRINRMHRWTAAVATTSTLLGVLAISPVRTAFAQIAPDANTGATADRPSRDHDFAHHVHDWTRVALALPSLTEEQRASIEQLAAARRTATQPVRQADANLLTVLAQQVEAGAVDPQAIQPAARVEEAAATSARAAEQEMRQRLHAILTPSQRAQIVDALESRMPPTDAAAPAAADHVRFDRIASRLGLSTAQQQQIASNLRALRERGRGDDVRGDRAARRQAHRAWLESFRGASFAATSDPATPHTAVRGDRTTRFVEAAVPVLTATQRTELAGHLRERAAREVRHG